MGHETDTTIADFVADLRAATPTAAAEQAVPLASDLRASLTQVEQQMGRSLQHFIEVRQQMLNDCQNDRWRLRCYISFHRRETEHLEGQLLSNMLGTISFKRQTMNEMAHRLESAAVG